MSTDNIFDQTVPSPAPIRLTFGEEGSPEIAVDDVIAQAEKAAAQAQEAAAQAQAEAAAKAAAEAAAKAQAEAAAKAQAEAAAKAQAEAATQAAAQAQPAQAAVQYQAAPAPAPAQVQAAPAPAATAEAIMAAQSTRPAPSSATGGDARSAPSKGLYRPSHSDISHSMDTALRRYSARSSSQ